MPGCLPWEGPLAQVLGCSHLGLDRPRPFPIPLTASVLEPQPAVLGKRLGPRGTRCRQQGQQPPTGPTSPTCPCSPSLGVCGKVHPEGRDTALHAQDRAGQLAEVAWTALHRQGYRPSITSGGGQRKEGGPGP